MSADRPKPESPDEGLLRVFNTREQTRAFYDKISRVYDRLAERSEAPMRRLGLRMLAARPGETIVEIGCGTGGCLVALGRAVGETGQVHGLDLSPGMVERAVERVAKRGLDDRVHVRVGDAVALPWPDDSVDGVFMSFTLELFDTPEIPVVLGECRRVLRPGGRLVVVGMSKGDHAEPLLRFYEWTHKHFPNFVDCRPIHVATAIRDAGFEVRRADLEHMWLPVEIVLATP